MNTLSIILTGISLFIISIFTRSIARIVNRNFGIDTWYYLLYAEEFRKNKKLPVNIPFYLLDEDDQFYPPGFPIFLSLFSQRFLQKYHGLINPVIDSLQVLLLYAFTFLASSSLVVSVLVALLYISSPILITQSSNLNSRMFGSLILTVILLSIYTFIQTNNIWFIVVCILSGIVLSFSHKMSMQQFVFLVLGFSILTFNYFYLSLLLIIFISSLLLGRRFYVGILRAHIEIIKFWSKNLAFLGLHQIYDSPLYKGTQKATEMKCFQGLRSSKFYSGLEKLRIVGIFIVAFWLFFYRRDINSHKFNMIFYWILINYFTVFSTSYLPVFKNFGEGHKYLSYGVFPMSFFLAYFLFLKLGFPYAYIPIAVILAINLIVSVYIIKVQINNILASIDEPLLKIFDTIKNLKEDRIMCLPFSKADAVAYFTRKKVLFGGHSLGWEKLDDFWPILKKPVEYFIDRYNIGYILVDDRYVDFNDLELKIEYKIIERQGNYTLMEIQKS